ncbi:MAG TPA: response regulator transcription factor [Desulfomicrobiaceae bacterium]|nr:response regulator transcription factor [Desulfomicrobiaceae bacterium]
MSSHKRIIIIDDHPMYREGLKSRLKEIQDVQVVGEGGTYADGMRLADKLQPDLAVLDISLPDGSGINLTRELRERLPELVVLIVSMHTAMEFIGAAFRAGASGYMSKDSSADDILHAIEKVLAGGEYLDGSLSPSVLKRLEALSHRKARSLDESYSSLSIREQQIMRLLAEGLSPDDIAARLFVTKKTVLNHRYAIMTKLGIKTPLAFIRHAARLGLIDLDEEK